MKYNYIHMCSKSANSFKSPHIDVLLMTFSPYACISLRGKNLFRRLVDLQKKATAAQRFCAPFHDQIKVLLA